jgi:hypothetical protein
VTFDPAKPRLGDPLLIYVEYTDVSVDRGAVQLLGYEVSLHRVSAGFLRGVAPIPMDVEPKKYPIQILIGEEQFEVELEIIDRIWETSELSVSRRFTQKKSRALQARLRREAREFKELWEREVTTPKFVGKVHPPLPGIRTSPFGVQRTFNGKKKSVHYGMDLDGRPGDPIKAVADGRVVLSSMRWASGGTIVLDHGGGLFTMYFHMSRRAKKPGQLVKRGDVLGDVGMTGRVTGPHLHLATVVRSVRLSGPRKGEARSMYVDPETLLGLELKGHPAFVTPVPPVAQQ